MREGPLSEYIDTYAAHLKLHNYSQAAGAQRIGIVAGLSRWMAKKNLVASNINESLLDQYCKYQKRTRTVAVNTHFYGALRRMLSLFRELGVSPHLLAAHDAREQLMQDFEKHLLDRRGLTRSSADTYVPIAREFTLECLPGKSLSWKKLSAGDVVRFIEGHEHARRVCSPLRSFLRYLHYTGAIKTDLASAVPAIARWKYAALPGSFQPAQIAQILRCCNRQSSLGKRDYAILLLLARLGLRANEIATLCLGDIDWHSGQLILKRTKTDELAKLPLPVEVGEAIADYLKYRGPSTTSRRVFLRERAPRIGFSSSTAIGEVVKQSMIRAGIDTNGKGAHSFRHSLATQLLNDGASLTENGQLLRHTDMNTTRIYAKTDVQTLRALAIAWPK